MSFLKRLFGAANHVHFVREDKKPMAPGVTYIYRVYHGSNEAEAMTFLKKNPVTQNFLYLIVETPEGTFGRDINGIYRE